MASIFLDLPDGRRAIVWRYVSVVGGQSSEVELDVVYMAP